MDTNSEASSVSMLDLEGVLVMKEAGEFSPPTNVPIIDYSVPPLVEKTSSRNPSFYVPIPFVARINKFHPDEMVSPIFGPNTPFWEISLGWKIYISQLGSTSAANVSFMELNPNPRRNLPYLLPSDIWVDH